MRAWLQVEGEQPGLKTNLLENTITVRFTKCPRATICHVALLMLSAARDREGKTLPRHPIHTTSLVLNEASVHLLSQHSLIWLCFWQRHQLNWCSTTPKLYSVLPELGLIIHGKAYLKAADVTLIRNRSEWEPRCLMIGWSRVQRGPVFMLLRVPWFGRCREDGHHQWIALLSVFVEMSNFCYLTVKLLECVFSLQ